MYGHRDYIIWLIWVGSSELAAFLTCLWALWRGGRSEQMYAGIMGSGWILSAVAQSGHHGGPSMVFMLLDIATLIGFTLLSLYDRRLWIAFAAACQINEVVTDLVGKAIHLNGYAYVTMLGVWAGWAQIVCLLIGMIQYERRRKTAAMRLAADGPKRVPSSAGILPPGSAPPHS
jgi:hypothetical protein